MYLACKKRGMTPLHTGPFDHILAYIHLLFMLGKSGSGGVQMWVGSILMNPLRIYTKKKPIMN
jgi:hypothetical protein